MFYYGPAAVNQSYENGWFNGRQPLPERTVVGLNGLRTDEACIPAFIAIIRPAASM
jgi:hypothetical protein